MTVTGIVDQHVNRTGFLFHGCRQRSDRPEIRDIQYAAKTAAGDQCVEFCTGLCIAQRADDTVPGFQGFFCQRTAKSAADAGDEE
ncbi:hypothetical protein D3C80_2087020 [compost metagenome]